MLVSELQALVAESKRRHPEVKEVCPSHASQSIVKCYLGMLTALRSS